MHLRPTNHSSEYHNGRGPAGRSVTGPEITVETADECGGVHLIFDPLPAETFDDRDVTRTLEPDEARELAAMLWHHADATDRARGLSLR